MKGLEDIKEGDEVCLIGNYSSRVVTVTRVTATAIFIGPDRYRKCDGYPTGDRGWNSPSIRAFESEAEKEAVKNEVKRKVMVNRLREVKWEELTLDEIRAVVKVLGPILDAKKGQADAKQA